MTSERAKAYGTALKTLRDLQPAKFNDREMEVFVEAADALLFDTAETDDALARAAALLDDMADSDRLMPETAQRIKDELQAIQGAAVAA